MMSSQKATASETSKKQRTSVKTKTDITGVPVFLRKTFQMVCTANADVVSWSDGGTSFVVKDPEVFAAEVIPEFFKHNNFSSFVRQLNFYGFRKIKSDPLRIRESEASDLSKYWKFRHEKFQEGREDLLVEIRKSSQTEGADKQEVDSLKTEVSTLKDEISGVLTEMTSMKKMMEGLADRKEDNEQQMKQMRTALEKQKAAQNCIRPVNSLGKKRMLSETVPMQGDFFDSEPIPAGPDFDLIGSPEGPEGSSSLEDNIFNLFAGSDLVDINNTDMLNPLPITSTQEKKEPTAGEKVCKALSVLPADIQNVFADRLALSMSDPESLRSQADSLRALAASASQEVSSNPLGSHLGGDPRVAAAVLEAFLVRRQLAANQDCAFPNIDSVDGRKS